MYKEHYDETYLYLFERYEHAERHDRVMRELLERFNTSEQIQTHVDMSLHLSNTEVITPQLENVSREIADAFTGINSVIEHSGVDTLLIKPFILPGIQVDVSSTGEVMSSFPLQAFPINSLPYSIKVAQIKLENFLLQTGVEPSFLTDFIELSQLSEVLSLLALEPRLILILTPPVFISVCHELFQKHHFVDFLKSTQEGSNNFYRHFRGFKTHLTTTIAHEIYPVAIENSLFFTSPVSPLSNQRAPSQVLGITNYFQINRILKFSVLMAPIGLSIHIIQKPLINAISTLFTKFAQLKWR